MRSVRLPPSAAERKAWSTPFWSRESPATWPDEFTDRPLVTAPPKLGRGFKIEFGSEPEMKKPRISLLLLVEVPVMFPFELMLRAWV